MEPVYINVYGTLKRTRSNCHCMGDSKFIAKTTTKPIYTMYTNGGFPIVTRGGTTAIHGELFKVTDEAILKGIYRLEGYRGTPGHPNNWYDIDPVKIGNLEASMFVQNPEQIEGRNLKVLPDGIF